MLLQLDVLVKFVVIVMFVIITIIVINKVNGINIVDVINVKIIEILLYRRNTLIMKILMREILILTIQ
jgi:hypothetical protein